ncbi:unnamed protein product [Lactuca virosa]|uniref:Uncharacterized protein n=1 Tax=Lactuca virosa TaxID=75947 RepID=A0AAU9P5I7_9ASTR|nr:unnamed protein product [Lactuca virosa]
MRWTRSQSLRRSPRMMELGFQSKFTNTAVNDIDLDDVDVLYIESGSSSVRVLEGNNVMMNVGNEGIAGGGRKLELPKNTNNGKSKKNDSSDDDFVERKKKMNYGKNENKMKRKRVEKIVRDKKVELKGKKVIRSQDKCKERKVGTEFQRLSTRMSPNSLYLAIKSLSKNQREMVCKMGFGSFLGMKIDTLPGKLAYFVVDSFTTSSCSIRVKSGEVPITNETVEAVFGLPNKGLDFKTLGECDKNDPLLEAWKAQYIGREIIIMGTI